MDSVRCLLIPLAEYNLLIPNAAIAEILGFIEPEPSSGVVAPEWVLGKVAWQGLTLDLISGEVLSGALLAPPKITQCIAVIRLPQAGKKLSCIALLCQRMPRLVLATSENVQLDDTPPPCRSLVGMRVRVNDERALIPDLDSLQNRLRAENKETNGQQVKESNAELVT